MIHRVLVKTVDESCKVGQKISAVVVREEGEYGAGGQGKIETDFYPVNFPLWFYWRRKKSSYTKMLKYAVSEI